jgi:hypothetical protein
MVTLYDEPGWPTSNFTTKFYDNAGKKDYELQPTNILIYGDV